jgi:hypothetical protein
MTERKGIDVGEIGSEFGDVISVGELATILGLKSPKTIYVWLAKHRLDGCFRRRGKRILIVRQLVLKQIFNGPTWSNK